MAQRCHFGTAAASGTHHDGHRRRFGERRKRHKWPPAHRSTLDPVTLPATFRLRFEREVRGLFQQKSPSRWGQYPELLVAPPNRSQSHAIACWYVDESGSRDVHSGGSLAIASNSTESRSRRLRVWICPFGGFFYLRRGCVRDLLQNCK